MSDRDSNAAPPKVRGLVRDIELWHEVARSITPMRSKRLITETTGKEPVVDLERPGKKGGKPSSIAMVAAAGSFEPAQHDRKPLTGLDRRTTKRLSRGQIQTDSRIDLHGETLETGRYRLLGFLRAAAERGDRLVLVITGKGNSPFTRHTLHGVDHFHAPEREGRLRRAFTHWLEETEFRRLVSGYQPAHPRHGGGGAFYVRLRRSERAGGRP